MGLRGNGERGTGNGEESSVIRETGTEGSGSGSRSDTQYWPTLRMVESSVLFCSVLDEAVHGVSYIGS